MQTERRHLLIQTKQYKETYPKVITSSLDILVGVVHPELCLEPIHGLFVQLKGLGKNFIRDGWLRSKDRIGYGDHTRVLAAQTSKSDSAGLPIVELEVDEALRKYKHITLVKDFSEELVGVRCDEADVERSFQHYKDLSCPWMGVRRIETIGCKVQAS